MTADILSWVLLLAIAAYACGGGVDYGAGFWDLLAGGAERGRRPRWLIDHAMAPVWEVNNVWLVFVLVLMWTGFPEFFQTVFTALWLPLALAAVGMVLRGAGFALRKPARLLAARRVYGATFAVASLLTPFFLGTVIGSVASGRVSPGTTASADAWANATSVTAGLLAVCATAVLGAVFLTADARRFGAHDLVGHFRLRARIAVGALLVVGAVGLVVTADDASYVHHGLTHGWGLLLVLLSAAAGAVTVVLVGGPAPGRARYSAVAAVALAVAAWGVAQRPYLVPTSLTVRQAVGASATLQWMLVVSLVALLLIGPAVTVLYRLDTRGVLEPLTDEDVAG
ncbi:cytochrome d ubiquinol oxidase subunit II [Streptomyces sp. BE20]|uniref:cytochrome d ubiquinol oxidase subunit II n=1 Tax=Streptomyces sp. BE20 TaxID=3002525 RepID=UPI002E79E95E|nr:cytochrome d ubiquinol oxidase subunit II [Streptomyces sp. BE20]MEE1825438.1 cytochrome d ubiquinol oxidase subunit II [Streptomyces sp. BE20]